MEEHIVIGNDRVINVPESIRRIAVQNDNLIETVTFDCPRYWDNHDLSQMYIYIIYRRSDGVINDYLADNIRVDGINSNLIHFDWTISEEVSQINGELDISIGAKRTLYSENYELRWYSEINNQTRVSQGFDSSEYVRSEYPDIINDLLTRMDGVLSADTPILDKTLTKANLAADSKSTGDAINRSNTELTNKINTDVNTTKNNLQSQINSLASGSPAKVYATYQNLINDNPDHNKIYVVASTGKWYFYNTVNSTWDEGGQYQSTGIADESVKYKHLENNLKELIDFKGDYIFPTWETGKAYYTALSDTSQNGKLGNASTSSASHISVNAGEMYLLSSVTGTNYANYVFFGENDVVIDIYPKVVKSSRLTKELLIIPNGCIKMGMSTVNNPDRKDFSLLKITSYKMKDEIVELETLSNGLQECFNKKYEIVNGYNWENAKGYYTSFPIGDANNGKLGGSSQHSASHITVNPGEEFEISTQVNSNIACYAIFNGFGDLIEIYPAAGSQASATTVKDMKIVIPENGRTLGFSTFTSKINVFSLKKYNGNTKINANIDLEPLSETLQTEILKYKPVVNGNIQSHNFVLENEFKYPKHLSFGEEYLTHWNEKIYKKDSLCKIVLDGDSITEGYYPNYSGINDAWPNMRGTLLQKIFTKGNFPSDKLSIVNNGHGGRNTNEYVGNATHGEPSYISQYPNGFLDVTMQNNPDLIIMSYGINDVNPKNFSGTLEDKINLFRDNMIEALERIRGNTPVNGRPAYNKSVNELSIIIMAPYTVNSGSGRDYTNWNQYLYNIIQELCRTYNCCFFDIGLLSYGNYNRRDWAVVESDGVTRSTIHPNIYTEARTISHLQELVYPICFWE